MPLCATEKAIAKVSSNISVTHSIDLIIPGLCGPLPDISMMHDSKLLSHAVSLLAKSSKQKTNVTTYPEQLCAIMGLNVDHVPLAELSLSAYGIDKQDYHWMHADPVHMMADVDHLVLYDSNSLKLQAGEAEILLEELNRHFKQDGIEFVPGDENHWFVKSKRDFNITTHRLNDAVMQNVNQLMPVGEGSVFCKQLLNESQMLLHANSVNSKREENGLLTANSLWLWGEGSSVKQADSAAVKCFGNDVLFKGISHHVGIDAEDVITIESIISRVKKSEKNIVVFDDLISACSYGDTSTWLTSFESLYESLLKPLIDYALNNNLEIRCYPCDGYQYVINSKTKYRFWKKGNMGNYFESKN